MTSQEHVGTSLFTAALLALLLLIAGLDLFLG